MFGYIVKLSESLNPYDNPNAQTPFMPSDNSLTTKGTLTFPNGAKYVGDLKDGKPNGQGTLTYLDGRQYVGKFKDGKYVGK